MFAPYLLLSVTSGFPEMTEILPSLLITTESVRPIYCSSVNVKSVPGSGNFLSFAGSAVLPNETVSAGLIGAAAELVVSAAVLVTYGRKSKCEIRSIVCPFAPVSCGISNVLIEEPRLASGRLSFTYTCSALAETYDGVS